MAAVNGPVVLIGMMLAVLVVYAVATRHQQPPCQTLGLKCDLPTGGPRQPGRVAVCRVCGRVWTLVRSTHPATGVTREVWTSPKA